MSELKKEFENFLKRWKRSKDVTSERLEFVKSYKRILFAILQDRFPNGATKQKTTEYLEPIVNEVNDIQRSNSRQHSMRFRQTGKTLYFRKKIPG